MKSFLNYLLYDENYHLVDQGFQQVSKAAAVGKSNPSATPEALTLEVAVEEEGYLYTYLSNEASASSSVVYFDDFTVEQQSYIVQVDDYYPFGASFDQNVGRVLENKYLYQGKEWQDDLNLNIYDFQWRGYDPMIGRTWQPDPEAEAYYEWSPYSWGMGNPINTIDPDGRNVYYINEDGEVILAKKEDGDHRFVNHQGRELDAMGKDASFVGGALATAEPDSKVWGSLGDTEQADNLRTTAGLYNSQQVKNEFNDLADIATGIGGLRQLFKQGYKGLLKYFGDDIAEQVVTKTSSSLTIQFGKGANQVSHAFRHVDELGLNHEVVKSAVETHFRSVSSQIVPGTPFNQVIEVAGKRIQYTAFQLKDGTINIGRIHGVN